MNPLALSLTQKVEINPDGQISRQIPTVYRKSVEMR